MLGCGNIDDAVDDTICEEQMTPKDFQIAIVEIGEVLDVIPEEREKSTDGNSFDDKEATETPAGEEREGTEADTFVKGDANMLEKVSLKGADDTKEVEMLLDDDAATQQSEMTNHVLSAVKLPNELDFDTNPTELFLCLQRKDWTSALVRTKNAPEEACIWISRKEDDDESVRWRLLPIHAAIIFGAPANVTDAVLECFTLGARARDDQGMLPLHLVFRQGGQQEIVNMLLRAFPDGVEVENSKGRTPMDIAKASSSPQRDAYVEALSNSALDERVLSDAELTKVQDSMAEQRTTLESKIEEMRKSQEEEIQTYQTESSEIQTKLLGTITTLEGDLVKTQENSQILVDHVADLEAQLDSRSATERFLATRISNLHAFLKDTSKSKEDVEIRLKQEIAQLFEEKLELQKTVSQLHEDKSEISTSFIESQAKLNDLEASLAEAVKAKDDALFKLREDMTQVLAEKLIMQETISDLRTEMGELTSGLEQTKAKLAESEKANKADDIVKTALETELVSVKEQKAVLQAEIVSTENSVKYKRLQGECDTLRIEAAKMKEELDKRMTHEQALSSRVSTLALQLADNMQDTSAEKSAFSTNMCKLERERTELRDTVGKLSNKLVAVAGHIDAMTKEQQVIVDHVSAQEREIAAAASDQGKIFSLIKVQEKFFSKMQQEGKDLAVAAKRHEAAIVDRATNTKRGELVRTVTLLKHRMIGAIDSALAGIPKMVNDDEDMVDQIVNTVKSAPRSAWSNKIHVDNETFEADVKSALAAQVVFEIKEEEEEESVVEENAAEPIVEKTAEETSDVEENFVTSTRQAEETLQAVALKMIQTQNSAYFMDEEKKDDDDTFVDPAFVSVLSKIAMLEQRKEQEKA
jgi:predicted  nucleic acid-binding Zn-ribbon protein